MCTVHHHKCDSLSDRTVIPCQAIAPPIEGQSHPFFIFRALSVEVSKSESAQGVGLYSPSGIKQPLGDSLPFTPCEKVLLATGGLHFNTHFEKNVVHSPLLFCPDLDRGLYPSESPSASDLSSFSLFEDHRDSVSLSEDHRDSISLF